jgi:putative aldouronate transport system substrate-binding protein
MKKLTALLVVATLAAAAVIAAGRTEPTATAAGTVELTAPGTFPIVTDEVTITLLTYATATQDMEANWLTQHLQEMMNIRIDWELAPTEAFKERMNLVFASGEFPDLVIASGNSLTDLQRAEAMRLIQQGVKRPLDDLIDTQSVWYRQRLAEDPEFEQAVTAPDGSIYHLAGRSSCYHCLYGQKMWINKVWLDNLGLDVPTSIDEFHEVLRAFKHEDANLTGDASDQWPLATSNAGAWVEIDGFLMSAFQFTDLNQWDVKRLYVDDGVVKAAFMEPGYQEGLRYLRRLWEEELIYPDSFVQDRTTLTQINQGGAAAVFGVIPGMHHGYLSPGTGPDVRWREYVAIPPLDGPAGRQTPYYVANMIEAGSDFIPAGARFPEVAFRMMDWLYSEEGEMAGSLGQKGVAWRDPEPGELGINTQPALFTPLQVPEDNPYYQNMTWGNRSTTYSTIHSWRAADQDWMQENPMAAERFLWHFSKEAYEPYAVPFEKMMKPLWYPAEHVSELAQINATLQEYVYESVVRFITGDLDIDADWNRFQTELRNIGAERFLEITQQAYDITYGQ